MTELLELYEQAPAQHESVDLRQTLVPMLDGLSRALGYQRALVALYDQSRETLRGSVGLNVPESLAYSLEVPINLDGSPLVEALLQGMPHRVDDIYSDTRIPQHTRELLIELGMESFVVAPLRTGIPGLGMPSPTPSGGWPGSSATSVVDGVGAAPTWEGRELPAVGIVLLSKEGTITDDDIEWLMPFANQAGVAIARASDVELLRSSSEQYAIDNEWLRQMVNAVDDPVVVTDAENNIIQQNRSAEAIFRSTPEDNEGKEHAIWMNNFLFTAALSTWKLEQDDSRANRDLTLVDPIEGTELNFEVISYPARHYRLGTVGTVSVLKNVTDLRRATEQLTENVQLLQSADEEVRLERDRLNLILSSVPNPIVVVDADNQTIRMNQQALRLFQPEGTAAPASGQAATLSDRRQQLALSNEAKFTSFLASLRLDLAQVKQGELTLIDPDSEAQVVMWVTASEIRDNLGAVSAVVAVMQNISTLRELEEKRVAEALFESEKLAATGRLAANVAHEINNPLEAIKNALYLLVNRIPEDDPNHRFLEIAKKETDRVSNILKQMLGFYRPAASMGPTDVNALIEDAEALVSKLLRQHGVRLQKDLSRDLPLITASGDQLKQVVLNLILNAQQAMPSGGTIFVTTRAAKDVEAELLRADAVQIIIRDTGIGISEENMPHIFQPFFSTKEGKGTGLGLWVSSGIVQSHGGNIRVRSRSGQGTTFTITLPIGGPPQDAEG